MLLPLFAEVDWNQGFYYGLVFGGAGMVLIAIAQFVRMMFASKEEAKAFESQHTTYFAGLGLGIVFLLGGLYFKNAGAGVAANSNDLSSFKEFVSKSGGFKAKFPGTPKEETRGLVGMSMKIFSVDEKDGMMGIAYIDVPRGENMTNQQINAILTGARVGLIKTMDGKLIKEDPITLQGKYKGREIRGEVPSKNAELFCSMYLVKGRVFQVMIIGRDHWMNSDKARKFLNSFTLLD